MEEIPYDQRNNETEKLMEKLNRLVELRKINEDLLMNFQVFNKAKCIVFDDATKYLYYECAEASSSRVPSEKKLLDSMKVFEYIFENCYEKSELKGVAARRLFYVLTNVYRYCVFYPQQDIQNKIRSQISQRITEIQPFCKSVSFKYRLNYQAMRKIPQFYKFLYRIYNSVRKSNWDVSKPTDFTSLTLPSSRSTPGLRPSHPAASAPAV